MQLPSFKTRRTLAQIMALAAVFHVLGSGLMAASVAAKGPVRIVAFGDSLTAGYMLPPDQAFPRQLEAALKARGHNVDVINAGVSGDTTAAALERFDWAVPDDADGAIVELGANDALRGMDPAAARRNLEAIIARLKQRRIPVLLAGMMAPRNWGADYVRQFDGMYAQIAKESGVALYPFFLDGVALDPKLTLSDGLHPTGAGIAEVVRRILPMAEDLVKQAEARTAAQ